MQNLNDFPSVVNSSLNAHVRRSSDVIDMRHAHHNKVPCQFSIKTYAPMIYYNEEIPGVGNISQVRIYKYNHKCLHDYRL